MKWDSGGLFSLLPLSLSSTFRKHSTSYINQRNTYQHWPLENAREMTESTFECPVTFCYPWPCVPYSLGYGSSPSWRGWKIGPVPCAKLSSTKEQWVGHWSLCLVENKLFFPTWHSQEKCQVILNVDISCCHPMKKYFKVAKQIHSFLFVQMKCIGHIERDYWAGRC